jgi:glycosyltransferase involved in cell wall biosynthesis
LAALWFDVEDLFVYAATTKRPSGIQRLAFEIYREVWERLGSEPGAVRFVRHHPVRRTFVEIPWSQIDALFQRMSSDHGPAAPKPVYKKASTRFYAGLIARLPPRLQPMTLEFVRLQREALMAWVLIARAIFRRATWPLRRALAGPGGPPPPPPIEGGGDEAEFKPGDTLLAIGSPWFIGHYGELVREAQAKGARFALLVYDIIPLRRPEWCDRHLVKVFTEWFAAVLPHTDKIFAISRYSADDLELYARQTKIKLKSKVQPIPIAAGFGQTPSEMASERPADLPPVGSYALIVSTIEARKNHMLLFRLWRRLMEDLPEKKIPTLVFAGRVGWLVDDFMKQLDNADWLGGKIVLVDNPTDDALAHLYRGCQFTLFPSFYEGWGLPVTESLAFGKPALISDRTSLPEAGGKLARYFDPDNLHDAYAALRAVIDDPKALKAWEAEVARDFKPVAWSETADALLAGLGRK